MSKSYVFLAEGFEEIEAITTVDVMRRAGMDVKTVSISERREVAGAHGVTVGADFTFRQVDFAGAEWLVLPGGMPGATNLASFEPLRELLVNHKGKLAAICASPGVVLAPLGLLKGKEATCYPGFEKACAAGGARMRDVPVMVSDGLVTGNGPSSSLRFALAIVANSMGDSAAQQVGGDMLFFPKTMNFYF